MVKWKEGLTLPIPQYPLYLVYQAEQVISMPQDPHAESHAKRHLEIFSFFGANIIEQKSISRLMNPPKCAIPLLVDSPTFRKDHI